MFSTADQYGILETPSHQTEFMSPITTMVGWTSTIMNSTSVTSPCPEITQVFSKRGMCHCMILILSLVVTDNIFRLFSDAIIITVTVVGVVIVVTLVAGLLWYMYKRKTNRLFTCTSGMQKNL